MLRPVLGGVRAEHRLVDARRLGLEDHATRRRAGDRTTPACATSTTSAPASARRPTRASRRSRDAGSAQREQLGAHRETRRPDRVRVHRAAGTGPPARAPRRRRERVIGPPWSSDGASGIDAVERHDPCVPLSPTTPQNADGRRIEPTVCVPIATGTMARRDGRGGAGRRAARRVVRRPRVPRRRRVLVGELGGDGLADDHRARRAQPRDERRVAIRVPVRERGRAARGRQAGHVDDVLDPDRHAVERPDGPAGRHGRIQRTGLGPRAAFVNRDPGAKDVIRIGDADERRVDVRLRTQLVTGQRADGVEAAASGPAIGEAMRGSLGVAGDLAVEPNPSPENRLALDDAITLRGSHGDCPTARDPWTSESLLNARGGAIMTPSPSSSNALSRGWTRRPASSSGTRSSRATRSRTPCSAPGGISGAFAIRTVSRRGCTSLTVNACLDQARRRRRRPIEVEVTDLHPLVAGDATDALGDRELVNAVLLRLDERDRSIIVLHYYLGLSLTETAEAIGMPVGSVKTRLYRALGEMRAGIAADLRPPSDHDRRRDPHMNGDRQLERALPEILADLGAGPTPDYTRSLLARTARTRQRPGWVFPERWINVDVALRPLAAAPSARRIILLAAVLLIAAIAARRAVCGLATSSAGTVRPGPKRGHRVRPARCDLRPGFDRPTDPGADQPRPMAASTRRSRRMAPGSSTCASTASGLTS